MANKSQNLSELSGALTELVGQFTLCETFVQQQAIVNETTALEEPEEDLEESA